jgi:hypothetical protein
MFGSTVLDLTLGLIFTFLIVSLVTSAATEALASALSWRANNLLQGIKQLLNDPQFTGLALRLYNHGLVNTQANGIAATQENLTAKPSYIDPKQFASALIELAGISPGVAVPALQAKINATVTDPQLNSMLNGIVERTGGDINQINSAITAWFNQSMDRVAGVYKRKTQAWALAIAVILTIALNLDTVRIAQALWDQPMLIKGLAPPVAGETAADAFNQLQSLGLPFGWDKEAVKYITNGPNWIFAIAGWLITAVATLFGAPFWFDTLQKFVQLRGAGAK